MRRRPDPTALDRINGLAQADLRLRKRMRKADLLRAIFAELRRNVAADIPDGDLLRFAHLILQSQVAKVDVLNEFGLSRERYSLFRAPLDEAIKDGGWSVLEFERRSARNDDEDAFDRAPFKSLIESYLGPEWQHHRWIVPLSPQ